MSQQCDQFRVCLLFLVFPFKKKKKDVIANDYILKIHFHVELNQQPFEKKSTSLSYLAPFLGPCCVLWKGAVQSMGVPPVLRQAGPVLGPRHWGCCLKGFQEPNSRKCIHEP